MATKPVIPTHFAAEILGTRDLTCRAFNGLRHDVLYHSFKRAALQALQRAVIVFDSNKFSDPKAQGNRYNEIYGGETNLLYVDLAHVPVPFPNTLFVVEYDDPTGTVLASAVLFFRTPSGVTACTFFKARVDDASLVSTWHLFPVRLDLSVHSKRLTIMRRVFGTPFKKWSAYSEPVKYLKHAEEVSLLTALVNGSNFTVALPGKPVLKNGVVTFECDGPVDEYKICYLEHGKVVHRKPHQGGTHAPPKQHMRRGHWRTSKNGVRYWVDPMVVGDPSRGYVEKEYVYAAA